MKYLWKEQWLCTCFKGSSVSINIYILCFFGDSSSFLYFSSLRFLLELVTSKSKGDVLWPNKKSYNVILPHYPLVHSYFITLRTGLPYFQKKENMWAKCSLCFLDIYIYLYIYIRKNICLVYILPFTTYISKITLLFLFVVGKNPALKLTSTSDWKGFGATKDTNLSEHCATRWGGAGWPWRIRKKTKDFAGIPMEIHGIPLGLEASTMN